jgi:hypothetical protein
MRWQNKKHIAQYSMSRAIQEATGHCHYATTCSVLALWLPGQQQKKQQQQNFPILLANLMAATVHRYDSPCIAQLRRSSALVEATGCRRQASIAAKSCNWS